MPENYLIPAGLILGETDLGGIIRLLGESEEIGKLLNSVGVGEIQVNLPDYLLVQVIFTNPLKFQIPGISDLELVIANSPEEAGSEIIVEIGFGSPFFVKLPEMAVGLRFSRNLLVPVDPLGEPLEEDQQVEFSTRFGFSFEGENFQIENNQRIDISSSFMIGDTGVVLQIDSIELLFDSNNAALHPSLPDEFRGVIVPSATVRYVKPDVDFPTISFRNAAIGTGGFWGEVYLGLPPSDAEPPSSEALETLFEDGVPVRRGSDATILEGMELYPVNVMGMRAALQYFGIGFEQSVPVWGGMQGFVFMPFTNTWVRLRASIGGPDGNFLLEVGGTGDEGLINLDTDVFQIIVDSIAYLNKEDINYAIISGSIKLKVPEGLNMPEFKADKISISEKGDIDIEGGWIKAPEQINIDLGGFKIGIREIGLGNEGEETPATRRQWVGFSGEVQLVEGLPIRGSVEGLKISWLQNPPAGAGNDIKVSLRGIAVDFAIPGTLEFSGSVNFDERTNLFKGHIRLNLIALRTEVEGQLMVGKFRDSEGREFGVFYIALSAQLPTGIPLAATGTALYGIRGLVGVNVGPGREEEDSWYEWYKGGSTADERYSVTPVNKWEPLYDNYGFGAGISLGTIYDDGTTISLNAMLVVLIPGPVILLEGKANLLKQRSDNKSEEGAFYLLAALDGRVGTFQLNIDIRYSLEDIITVGGGLEAFFDFNNSENWHIWIGQKDPEAKRIRAEILSLFSANTYFMIDPKALMFGASVGINLSESYGPVLLRLIIKVSVDAVIFFKPFQLEGALQFLLDINLSVFGIGLRLYLEALLSGKTPEPFEIYGKAKIIVGLFWPLPTIECEVEFRWEEQAETLPAWPLFKGIGESSFIAPNPSLPRVAVMQHHKSSELRVALLAKEEGTALTLSEIESIPIAPVDARPALTFSKKIHFLGEQQLLQEPDLPGNGEFWYHLDDIQLDVSENGVDYSVVRHGINSSKTEGLPFFKINVTEDVNNGDGYFQNSNDAEEPVIELWKYHLWDRLNLYQRQTQTNTTPPCGTKSIPGYSGTVEWMEEIPRNLPPEFEHQGLTFITDLSPINTQNEEVFREPYINTLEAYESINENKKITMLRTRNISVFFPEKCIEALVYIFFDLPEYRDGIADDLNSIKVQAFLRGEPVGTITKKRQSGYLIFTTTSIGSFDSLRIFEDSSLDKAFWVAFIFYKTQGATELVNSSTLNTDDNDPILENGYTRKDPILLPNKYYRITTTTRVSGSKSISETTCLYFRTDNGPGIHFDPRFVGTYLPYGPTIRTDSTTEKIGNPASQLSSYISGTFPINGSMSHYLNQPIVIGFNERYVLKIFEEQTLFLKIKDRNSNFLGTTPDGGNTIFTSTPLLHAGLMSWLLGLNTGSCNTSTHPSAQMVPGLLFHASGLKPRTLYFAELVTSIAGLVEPVVLYDFQFTTSQYASFADHFEALGLNVEAIVTGRVDVDLPLLIQTEIANNSQLYLEALLNYNRLMETLESDSPPNHLEITELFQDLQQKRTTLTEISSSAFEILDLQTNPSFLFELNLPDGTSIQTDMRYRGLPDHPEIIAIPLDGSDHYLLLLESPESIDLINIKGTIDMNSGITCNLSFVANNDSTRCFFIAENDLKFESGEYRINLEWIPSSRFETSISEGSTDPESLIRNSTEFRITIENF